MLGEVFRIAPCSGIQKFHKVWSKHIHWTFKNGINDRLPLQTTVRPISSATRDAIADRRSTFNQLPLDCMALDVAPAANQDACQSMGTSRSRPSHLLQLAFTGKVTESKCLPMQHASLSLLAYSALQRKKHYAWFDNLRVSRMRMRTFPRMISERSMRDLHSDTMSTA